MGRKGERFFTSMYKGHMDKTKGDRIKCGNQVWGWLGWVGMVGGKWRQLYLNSNKNIQNKKRNKL